MTDLHADERKAFHRAFPPPFDDLGPAGLCTCGTYLLPIEDHDEECAVRALYEGWIAAREYSKQREEKLREAVAFLRSCLRSGEVSGADHPLVVAALAENEDSDPGRLGDRRPGA